MTIEFHKIVEGDWDLYLGDGGEGEIRFDVFKDGDGSTRDVVIANITYGTAHALADWIITNVPKPEPTPLPTKFAAVVKSNGFRFMRAAEDAWYRQGGGMCHDEDIRSRGFEIISEGVDD